MYVYVVTSRRSRTATVKNNCMQLANDKLDHTFKKANNIHSRTGYYRWNTARNMRSIRLVEHLELSSSSSSSSWSAGASWYCWYSATRSFMLLSASVNFHLIHSFSSVPVQEGFPPEHGRELLAHSPEHLLYRSRFTNKSWGHGKASRRGMSHTLDLTLLGIHSTKAGRVLVLHIHYLFVHFLCAHLSPKHRGSRPSSSDRGMDRLHTSCSWHPTFVVSASSGTESAR